MVLRDWGLSSAFDDIAFSHKRLKTLRVSAFFMNTAQVREGELLFHPVSPTLLPYQDAIKLHFKPLFWKLACRFGPHNKAPVRQGRKKWQCIVKFFIQQSVLMRKKPSNNTIFIPDAVYCPQSSEPNLCFSSHPSECTPSCSPPTSPQTAIQQSISLFLIVSHISVFQSNSMQFSLNIILSLCTSIEKNENTFQLNQVQIHSVRHSSYRQHSYIISTHSTCSVCGTHTKVCF